MAWAARVALIVVASVTVRHPLTTRHAVPDPVTTYPPVGSAAATALASLPAPARVRAAPACTGTRPGQAGRNPVQTRHHAPAPLRLARSGSWGPGLNDYFLSVVDVDPAAVVESCMAAAVVPVALTVVAAGFVDDDPHAANGNTRAKPVAASTPRHTRFEYNTSHPPSAAWWRKQRHYRPLHHNGLHHTHHTRPPPRSHHRSGRWRAGPGRRRPVERFVGPYCQARLVEDPHAGR